ncbi:ABC transporter permease [Microbacterium halotolerans]|uniref:ABC transporter permease n=1 Tax=Microbacterium halotolerans TaxID=246613 RepID=UPI000E6A9C47|nr:ABC transporter permease subunit [Microbacterium halotolerans]
MTLLVRSRPAALSATAGVPAPRRRRAARTWRSVRRGVLATVVFVLAAALLWEGYKLLGALTGGRIPGTGLPLPISASDQAMPHILSILKALGAPASAVSDQALFVYLLQETSITMREAGYGLLLGAAIGVVLAVALREIPVLARGVVPWLVVSQTIPLVALAPVIVIWVGRADLPSWVAVTIISAYLSFFPVTVNMLTGLNATESVHVELMRSVNARRWQTLVWLRLPAAVPSLFSGLRLAATASVIGAIVGELSAGTGSGIGRAILSAAYFYSNAPETLFAAVLVASLAGVLFVQIIAVLEIIVLRRRNA